MLVACGSPKPPVEPVHPTVASNPTADTPTDNTANNIIKVGISRDVYPPFLVDSKQPAGMEIDLMNAIAETANIQVEYIPTLWGQIFSQLEQRKLDMVMAAISITPERSEQFNFSQPYFKTGQAIIVPVGSSIKDVQDLAKKRVGVQTGTTGEIWVQKNSTAKLISVANVEQLFESIPQGQADAIVYDQLIALNLMHDNPEWNLTMLDSLVTNETYGIVVHKDNPMLLEQINYGLQQLIASNRYQQICDSWFDAPQACVAITAALPATEMPPALDTATPLPIPTEPGISATVTPIPTEPTQTGNVDPAVCEGYKIATGDWLSKIAAQHYGDPVQYRPMIHYNNQRCSNTAYACISNPNIIDVGWCLYLPNNSEIQDYWSGKLNDLLPCNPAGVNGNINISGSSTVYPLAERLIQQFKTQGFAGNITISNMGTGEGFAEFCEQGSADIVNASRPIKNTEQNSCRATGSEPLAFQVATDAVTIIVSKNNNFLTNITEQQLQQIFSTATNWSDVNPYWPTQPIKRVIPGTQHGTFDYFVERIFANDAGRLTNASNISLMDDNEQLVQTVASDPLAIGFVGYAYYLNNFNRALAVSINDVSPRQETVDTGTYPLLRPLYIYSSKTILTQKPQVAEFVNCYLQNVRNEVNGVGYFLPDETDFDETKQRFREAMQ
jgi:phosphate transport system substrate-binding protein